MMAGKPSPAPIYHSVGIYQPIAKPRLGVNRGSIAAGLCRPIFGEVVVFS